MKFNIDDLRIILEALEDEIIIQRAATLTHIDFEYVKAQQKLNRMTKVYGKIALIYKVEYMNCD